MLKVSGIALIIMISAYYGRENPILFIGILT